MRKRLELILTALLPVAVLSIGFVTFSSKAGLNSNETASPKASGDYYRAPGKDGMYFGPEVYSSTLNGGPFNNGFEIVYTNECGSVSASSTPNAVSWHRNQVWSFSTDPEHDTPPWGTTSSYIALRDDLGWDEISLGGGTTGYPWAGYEIHESEADSLIVSGWTDVTGYRRHPVDADADDEPIYICPMYYKTGDWVYDGATGGKSPDNVEEYKQSKGRFGPPMFRDEEEQILSRFVADLDRWFDCIELN